MKFKINNDLDNLVWDFHNMGHVVGAYLLTLCLGFWPGYLLWLAWEIGDGFKPWWYEFHYWQWQTKLENRLRAELFYSNKFSLQDVLVWNLTGAGLGELVNKLIEVIL